MRNIQNYIEHTALSPLVIDATIDKLIEDAREHNLFGICLPPFWVKKAKREIGDAKISLVTVIGFPLGYQMSQTKEAEMNQAIKDGADELDLVLNISAFKAKMMWPKIEIAKFSKLAHEHNKILKVIIETAYLDQSEIIELCKICTDAGADFVKTSTGFAPSGATVENIQLMRKHLPDHVGIKASGGIKTHEQAVALIEAGADRIGTSNGVRLLSI